MMKMAIFCDENSNSDFYPGDMEFSPSFDDINPIWRFDGTTLAFERVYKSGEGKNQFFIFKPLDIKPIVKLVSTDFVAESTSTGGRSERKKSLYNSDFCWLGNDKKDTDENIYKYIYSKGSNLYFGQIYINQDNFSLSIDDKVTEEIFFSTKDGQNRYADYSANNNMVAFVSGSMGNGDIYVKSLDNDKVFRVTDANALEVTPKWSPNGEMLAYSSSENKNMDIYVISNIRNVILSEEKAEIKQLTESKQEETNPTWSPNGKFIAFYSLRDRSSTQMEGDKAETLKFQERNIFDIKVVDLNGNSAIVAEDVYRQERKGPVWVSLPGIEDQYIFFTTSEYNSIKVVNVNQCMNSKRANAVLIKDLAGYNFGNITDIDCITDSGDRLAEFSGMAVVYLAYSAMINNFQKRIYCAEILPIIDEKNHEVNWKVKAERCVRNKEWIEEKK